MPLMPLMFANHFIKHLPHIGSNHNPILLSKIVGEWNKRNDFRYETMWHFHPDFRKKVALSWDNCMDYSMTLFDKLNNLAKDLDQWNRSSFGIVLRETNMLS